MLVSFKLENWKSFKDLAELSMVATNDDQHEARISKVPAYETGLLPIAAIYGGNAAGKTNLFSALEVVRNMIVEGSRPAEGVPVTPFLLDSVSEKMPTSISVELLVETKVYRYSFTANPEEILKERLDVISPTKSILQFSRNGKRLTLGSHIGKREREFLNFAFRATRNNELFLNSSVSKNIKRFAPVHDWFRDKLFLISPSAIVGPFDELFASGSPKNNKINDVMKCMDTGVDEVTSKSISIDQLQLSEIEVEKMKKELGEGGQAFLIGSGGRERVVVSKSDGKLQAKLLKTIHSKDGNEPVEFELDRESAGTVRLVDLVPMFIGLGEPGQNRVFVVDELDRSLHSLLTRRLILGYLNGLDAKSRSQLIFTTHDLQLMSQEILRRDEMWIAERDFSGASKLFAVSDYSDIGKTDDILAMYLSETLGGVPRLSYQSQ